ncbi:hypothetical protein [Methanospirillum lacunae]|uniref:hypothetical protein n=1 Tax=Methanospirillum lacunae TaxID=668570 RepID=UPI0038FC8BAF
MALYPRLLCQSQNPELNRAMLICSQLHGLSAILASGMGQHQKIPHRHLDACTGIPVAY